MGEFYVIANMRIEEKIRISENIIAHPFKTDQDLHETKNTNMDITVLRIAVPADFDLEVSKHVAMDDLFGKGFRFVTRYLSCLQLTELACYDFNQSSDRETMVPMGFVINKMHIGSSSFEELTPAEIKTIDICSAATPFYTGSYGFDSVDFPAKGDFDKGWKLFEKCTEIIGSGVVGEEKKISILLKNILFRYYLAKTSVDILYSVFNYMSIIESMYGDREEIKGSIQRRVPKLLGDKTGNISKFLKKMYDERSVLAHNKTDYGYGMYGDRGIDGRERVILANMTGWLINIWIEKVYDGQTRDTIKKSTDSM